MVRHCFGCKADEHNTRTLELMLGECGHPLCSTCVNRLFKKATGRCPADGCGKGIKRSNLREQVLEDPWMDKENDVRKRLADVLLMTEEDFPSQRHYNDFLEMSEDLVHKLATGCSKEAEAQIKQLKQQTKEMKSAHQHVVPAPPINGPTMPAPSEFNAYLVNMKKPGLSEITGGYLAIIGCSRALLEAHQDLFSS